MVLVQLSVKWQGISAKNRHQAKKYDEKVIFYYLFLFDLEYDVYELNGEDAR